MRQIRFARSLKLGEARESGRIHAGLSSTCGDFDDLRLNPFPICCHAGAPRLVTLPRPAPDAGSAVLPRAYSAVRRAD